MSTTYNPDYYRSLIAYQDSIFKKASEVLEKQEQNIEFVRKAAAHQDIYNYQLKDASIALQKDHAALKQKNSEYKKYVELLEKQRKKLSDKLQSKTKQKSEQELKSASELARILKEQEDTTEKLRQLQTQYSELEHKYEELNRFRETFNADIDSASKKASSLAEEQRKISEENKKIRQVLRLEEKAVQMVEKDEFRRLDQLSLIDPIYADYLRRRWYLDGNRDIKEWETEKFGTTLPPLGNPYLSSNEEKSHVFDRLKLMETYEDKVLNRTKSPSNVSRQHSKTARDQSQPQRTAPKSGARTDRGFINSPGSP